MLKTFVKWSVVSFDPCKPCLFVLTRELNQTLLDDYLILSQCTTSNIILCHFSHTTFMISNVHNAQLHTNVNMTYLKIRAKVGASINRGNCKDSHESSCM